MNCQKTSDNKFFDCPARMNDGRQFTDYRPSCDMESSTRVGMSSYDYRMFLTQNASQLMDKNRSSAASTSLCSVCDGNTVPPPSVVQICTEKDQCTYQAGSPYGIGLMIKNSIFPEKCSDVKAPKNNVCYSSYQKQNYLPKNGALPQRFASPGAGTPYRGGDYVSHS